MIAHGSRGALGIVAEDHVANARVLGDEPLKVGCVLLLLQTAKAHPLSRDDEATKKFQKAEELRIAGRFGNGAMKGKVLRHRHFPATDGLLEARVGKNDPAQRAGAGTAGR